MDTASVVKELEGCCAQIRSHYLEQIDSNNYSNFSVPSGDCYFKNVPLDFLEPSFRSVSEQLNKIFENAALNYRGHYRHENIWMSFALRDLEAGIQSIAQQCFHSVCSRTVSHFRLGRLYAWARDQSSSDADDTEQSLLRIRLRRRLARMVWLVRASKRRGRSHPMLVSLRHELLKIRTRSTGRLLSDKASPTGLSITWKDGLLPQLGWEEAYDVCLKQVVPSHFHHAFERLIDRVTALFLELPDHVPGVSISDVFSFRSNRNERYRELVARLILNFYNHLDSWTDVTAEKDDEHDGVDSTNPSLLTDSETELTDCQDLETGKSKIESELNPAYVQAALDRFDHYCRTSRKRTIPNFAAAAEEDRLAIDTVTNSLQPTVVDTPYRNQEEEKVALLQNPSPVCSQSTQPKSSNNKEKENSEESNKELPLDENIAPPVANTAVPDAIPETADKLPIETVVPASSSSSRRRTNRSLRTRRSRTPSDASYSEGEVLSDSEEERADSLPEAEGHMTEICERTNIDIEEEEAEELIRMVNDQLRDPTPASDIDLTELEIMDEWAPPTSSLIVSSRSDESQLLCDEHITEAQVDASLIARLEEVDKHIASLLSEAEELCSTELNALISHYEHTPSSDTDATHCVSMINKITLPEDTEASIERTASAFKEHVTSVLANLLHAIPSSDEIGNAHSSLSVRQVVTGRRGSRLLGMLRSYRQDVVKRMNLSVA